MKIGRTKMKTKTLMLIGGVGLGIWLLTRSKPPGDAATISIAGLTPSPVYEGDLVKLLATITNLSYKLDTIGNKVYVPATFGIECLVGLSEGTLREYVNSRQAYSFTAQESKSYGQAFTIPQGHGGELGMAIVVAYDPNGVELARDFMTFQINSLAISYGASVDI